MIIYLYKFRNIYVKFYMLYIYGILFYWRWKDLNSVVKRCFVMFYFSELLIFNGYLKIKYW